MKMIGKLIFNCAMAPLFFLALHGPAYAYLDPGTGSMLLQIILGGVAGSIIVIKLYWQNLKMKFSRKKLKQTNKAGGGKPAKQVK